MSDQPYVRKPPPEVLAELDARIARFLEQLAEVPEDERFQPTDGKFAGPVADTVIDPATGQPL